MVTFFLLLNVKYQIKWLVFTPFILRYPGFDWLESQRKHKTLLQLFWLEAHLDLPRGSLFGRCRRMRQCFVWQALIGNPDGDHRLVQTAGAAGRAPGGDWPQELFVCCLSFIYCALWASGVSTKARSIMPGGDLPGKESWPASNHC